LLIKKLICLLKQCNVTAPRFLQDLNVLVVRIVVVKTSSFFLQVKVACFVNIN